MLTYTRVAKHMKRPRVAKLLLTALVRREYKGKQEVCLYAEEYNRRGIAVREVFVIVRQDQARLMSNYLREVGDKPAAWWHRPMGVAKVRDNY